MAKKTARKSPYHHGDLERALVQAALRTIRENGVDALTLRGVGAELNVSRTALYRHFADKAALLSRVAQEGFRLLHEVLAEADQTAVKSGTDRLEAMSSAYFQFAVLNPSHYQTMFELSSGDRLQHPDLREYAKGAFAALLNGVPEAHLHRNTIISDPNQVADVWWSLMHGLSTLALTRQLGRTMETTEKLAALSLRMICKGLCAESVRTELG